MILYVDPSTGEAKVVHGQHESCKVTDAINRIAKEHKDYKEYKQRGGRFAAVGTQEFQHMLMAVEDMITELHDSDLTSEERQHLLQAASRIATALSGNPR